MRQYAADESQTIRLGAACATLLRPGTIVFLTGSLGSGKTTLARGMLYGLGHRGSVKSPTYTIVEPYRIHGRDVYHLDLYRIRSVEELECIGVRELFGGQNVCLVEWAQRAEDWLPEPDLIVSLEIVNHGRMLHFTARGNDIDWTKVFAS